MKDDVFAELRIVHGNKYEYPDQPRCRTSEKIQVVCKTHGAFKVRLSSHKRGVGCAKCAFDRNAALKRTDGSSFIEKAKQKHGDRYDYSLVKYVNTDTKVEIVCKKHGVFNQTPHKHLKGQGCPTCGVEARASSRRGVSLACAVPTALRASNFISKAQLVHGKRYDYSKVKYVRNSDDVEIVCSKHGSFFQAPNNHLAGKGCSKCVCAQPSACEGVLHTAFPEFKQSDRTILSGKELDLYSEQHKLAIEVDGIHWHSSKFKPDNYHLYKTEQALNKGVTLLHFWDYEVVDKLDIVKSMIRNRTGLSDRLYARQCIVGEVSSKEASLFEDANHIQGQARSSIRYGLFYKGELVALMTFGKARYNKNYKWEMIRFCSKLNLTVVGGASKLFKHFTTHNPGSVISYANRRFSQGGLYVKLGFTLICASKPNYMYVKDGSVRFSRNTCQKHKLPKILGDNFDSALSERKNMENNGYYRLYDCGNYVFEFTQHLRSFS